MFNPGECLKDLDRAYANLYAGRAASPASRKKFLRDAFRYPQGFQVDSNQVYLPGRSGPILSCGPLVP